MGGFSAGLVGEGGGAPVIIQAALQDVTQKKTLQT